MRNWRLGNELDTPYCDHPVELASGSLLIIPAVAIVTPAPPPAQGELTFREQIRRGEASSAGSLHYHFLVRGFCLEMPLIEALSQTDLNSGGPATRA